jgi:hypothetical protein
MSRVQVALLQGSAGVCGCQQAHVQAAAPLSCLQVSQVLGRGFMSLLNSNNTLQLALEVRLSMCPARPMCSAAGQSCFTLWSPPASHCHSHPGVGEEAAAVHCCRHPRHGPDPRAAVVDPHPRSRNSSPSHLPVCHPVRPVRHLPDRVGPVAGSRGKTQKPAEPGCLVGWLRSRAVTGEPPHLPPLLSLRSNSPRCTLTGMWMRRHGAQLTQHTMLR